MTDNLTSYITYDGDRFVMPMGSSVHHSINPIVIQAGSTSVLYVSNAATGRIRTVIGPYVDNVRHMNEGYDRVNNRELPECINSSTIENLRYRGSVSVGLLTLPPGRYNVVLVIIIDREDFDHYCEEGSYGTNDRICDIKRRVEEDRFECDLQRYFFYISISIFVHIIFIILVLVMILHWSRRL